MINLEDIQKSQVGRIRQVSEADANILKEALRTAKETKKRVREKLAQEKRE